MRAYGIARVSTGKQAKFGASLEMQIARIEQMALSRNAMLIKTFVDEGVSGGETTKRVEYTKLKELVKAGQVDIIFTYHMSRYGRNFDELQLFWKLCEKKGVIIEHDQDHFDYRGTIGKLMRNIMGAMAEFIKDTASDTTSSTLQNLKKDMRKYTNEPYGYKTEGRIIGEDGKVMFAGKLVPHEKEAVIATAMLTMKESGKSFSAIARWLNDNNVKPKRGKTWSHSQVQSVLITFKSLSENNN